MQTSAHPSPFLSVAVPLAFTLAGGWQLFLAIIVLLVAATIYSLYTRTGSAINQRPYANVYTSAPGAKGASTLAHDESGRDYSRGTR